MPMVMYHRYLNGTAVDQVLADEQVNPITGVSKGTTWLLGDNLGTVRLHMAKIS